MLLLYHVLMNIPPKGNILSGPSLSSLCNDFLDSSGDFDFCSDHRCENSELRGRLSGETRPFPVHSVVLTLFCPNMSL